jgi:hypothetical protein
VPKKLCDGQVVFRRFLFPKQALIHPSGGMAICAISCEGPSREVPDRKARDMPEEAGRRKKFTRVVAILAFAFLAMQFVRPALRNPPVTADLEVPGDVKQILKTSCYNCHSNETRLSWFDKPMPAFWIVAGHVQGGRKHLNFSEIGKLPIAQQQAFLFKSVSQIELGAMPMPAYQRLHPESAVSDAQLGVLKNYLHSLERKTAETDSQIKAADAQYENWIHQGRTATSVAAAPNGIAFLPEYKNWKEISSTERDDNHTLRVILGNEIAVDAIAHNRINPWPDGTAFAKVAWLQQANDKGLVQSGAFFQVEFMVRDSNKFADTLGWGFARWRGADLKPYGKDATFTNECVGCHIALAKTDYVFTAPIGGPQ